MKQSSNNRKLSSPLAAMFLVALILPSFAQAGDDRRPQGRLMAQLTQFDGGCGPNECADVQFSIHRAPVCPNGPDAEVGDYSVSTVCEFSGKLAGGTSTLARADSGLAFNINSTELRRNAPYTVWWVAFNPDNDCISGEDPCNCSMESLRPGMDAVFYATGAMTDRIGTVQFSGNIDYGEVPTGFDQVPFGGLFGVGIQPGAEIHFVIRDHNPALRGGGRKHDDDDD